ncbi:MAG: Na+/H+ antiporter subunit B [Alcanivoracaceae bacterium]|nr:Na+/H+ antiporter subunit B [Alcanivoracaceae bacterium]
MNMPKQPDSLILRVTGHFLLPLLIMFSLFLLLRGHNEPGGGFIGGLVASAAIALHLFFTDVQSARRLIWLDPRDLLGWGLSIAIASGVIAMFSGLPFLSALWTELTVPMFGMLKIGTPLMFDIGVYLVVIGTVLNILLSLAEAEEA